MHSRRRPKRGQVPHRLPRELSLRSIGEVLLLILVQLIQPQHLREPGVLLEGAGQLLRHERDACLSNSDSGSVLAFVLSRACLGKCSRFKGEVGKQNEINYS